MRVSLSKEASLTASDLRERVSYDPAAGLMTWRKCSNARRIGSEIGTISPSGYRVAMIGRRLFQVHRLAWLYVHGVWPDGEIDHVNRKRADNRLCNLRVATRVQNIANRAAQNGREMKGITFTRGRWQAQIRKNGRNIYLGLYDTAEEAHSVYFDAARRLYGDYARAGQ